MLAGLAPTERGGGQAVLGLRWGLGGGGEGDPFRRHQAKRCAGICTGPSAVHSSYFCIGICVGMTYTVKKG
jgi:hypothetical protein